MSAELTGVICWGIAALLWLIGAILMWKTEVFDSCGGGDVVKPIVYTVAFLANLAAFIDRLLVFLHS